MLCISPLNFADINVGRIVDTFLCGGKGMERQKAGCHIQIDLEFVGKQG